MKILEKGLICLYGLSNVGKTTILINVASKSLMEGKKVLYISGDSNYNSISNKIIKNLSGRVFLKNIKNFEFKRIHDFELKELRTNEQLIDILTEYQNKGLDSVLIDFRLINDAIIDKLRELNVHSLYTINSLPSKISNHTVDVMLSLKKTKKSRLQNIKYFLLFWKQKPNLIINIIKNRFGEDGLSEMVYLDFKTAKIVT